jgi:DNA uptake protein ComE-like DNA-binding protein
LIALGLLELLAVVGAAWIATARIDRGGSLANVANTQIDLLVEGVRSMAVGLVVDSPPSQAPVSASGERWLASRVPEVAGGAANWASISGPVVAGGAFQSPVDGASSTVRTDAKPTSVTINGRSYPALVLGGRTLLAADADRDGIADAGLWPIPVGQINGVTYYAAVRIVDHNSAVNAAVAWKPNDDAPSLPANLFPTNVSLLSLLKGGAAEMGELNKFRFGNGGGAANITPIDDAGVARGDFAFVSPYDAAWMQLGRRLGNPGFNFPGQRYRRLPASDSIALAYGFIRRNGADSPCTVESVLAPTLLNGVPTVPYRPDQVAGWTSHFSYATAEYSRRCLLVGANAVTNQIAPISINGPANPQPGHSAMQPYPAVPVKASINTATFKELWRAFWSVMAKSPGGGTFSTPFGDLGNTNYNPFDPVHPQRMFKSTLRDMRYTDPAGFNAATARLAPPQQLLLRAALAATNAMDLRDPDPFPTPQVVRLTARIDDVDTPVDVTLYGGEPQPFLTEVYAHTDVATTPSGASGPNQRGYVAIELFNPYSVAIPLDNTWRLATIERRRAGGAVTTALPIAQLYAFPSASAPVVPAGGYLVIENYKSDNTGTAKYRPASSGLPLTGDAPAPAAGSPPRNFHYVANLDGALDRELVLLKQATGGPGNLESLCPIDSFDFTGLVVPAAAPFEVLHYVRNNDVDAKRWACVYPGRYDGTKAKQRQEGTQQDTFDLVTVAEPAPLVAVALGSPDAAASYTNPFIPIQWCNADTPGAFGVGGATGNLFPFGGFARLGDILQVPFMGPVGAASGTVLEMNALPMDCSFADDGEPFDDNVENVGRFCPTFAATSAGPPPASSGGFDLSLCPRGLEPTMKVTKPSAPGVVELRNEAHGGFMATIQNSLKGYFTPCQDGFDPGTLRFINCGGGDITRYPCPPGPAPVHTDVFWTAGKWFHRNVVVEYIDCAAWNTEGEAFLWESGSARRILYRNCWINNPYHINYLEVNLCDDSLVEEVVLDGGWAVDRNGAKIPMDLHFTVKGAKKNGRVLRVYRNNDVNGRKARILGYPGVQIIDGLPPDLGGPATGTTADYYDWSSDLFHYFSTIANPNDDYLPNHAQRRYYDASTGQLVNGPVPQAVPNGESVTPATANGDRENAQGIEGLININTAPWKVIATIPMLPDAAANDALAQAIVLHRENAGPFSTLYDLYQVPEFKAASDAIVAGAEPDDEQGDLSPLGGGALDKVRGDFEERFLLLNRVSNFITFRSDVFTCYLLIQGWKNAGSGAPELAVERRMGLIIDRTPITSTTRAPKVTAFPLE